MSTQVLRLDRRVFEMFTGLVEFDYLDGRFFFRRHIPTRK